MHVIRVEMPPFRRGSVPATARHDELSASTSQRIALSRPGPEGSSSAPGPPGHRRYEALRAYLHDGPAAAEVAPRFGYTPAALLSAVRDFRTGAQEFFPAGTPGPKSAPAKDAARQRILELRAAGHSIDEIAEALAAEGIPLNRTGIAEVIAEHGLPRLWRRPDTVRGGARREVQPRAELLDFNKLPEPAATRMAGLLLTIPDLLALDLPALVTAAGYPATQIIPALNYLLSLLALKLTATRRVSHVEDLAADPGAALFAGLTALPKTTALTSYSYRLQHAKQAAFLTALDKATLATGLATGDAVNLDFHAVMHWGADPALEKHYVPSRSQRTRSVLTFFAEDADSHTLLYANADLFKATQSRRGTGLRRPLEGHHRSRPEAADHGQQGHHPTRAWQAHCPRHHLHHVAGPPPPLTSPLHAQPASDWTHSRSPAPVARPATSRSSTTPPPPFSATPAQSGSSPSPAWAMTNPPC